MKKCVYDYQNSCTCAEDDKCGCDYNNNMAHDFVCDFEEENILDYPKHKTNRIKVLQTQNGDAVKHNARSC